MSFTSEPDNSGSAKTDPSLADDAGNALPATAPVNLDCDSPPCTRSTTYYLDSITFRVENTLFKVPQYRFIIDSTAFGAMFSLPGQIDPEGLSDDKPIVLSGVTSTEFTRFLSALYPRAGSDLEGGSCEEWTSVLKLATLWGFKEIRSTAIEKMSNLIDALPTLEKIDIAHQHGIDDWFLDGLNELVVRAPSISDDDAVELGWKWALRLLRERESCLLRLHRNQVFSQGRCSQAHHASLRKEFEEELKEIQYICSSADDGATTSLANEGVSQKKKKKKKKMGFQ